MVSTLFRVTTFRVVAVSGAGPRRSPVGAMVLGVSATVVYTLPLFLTGALAVELTRELAFGSAGLGVAVAANRVSAAALTPVLGRVADQLGATRSLRLSAGIAAVASLGIATTARNWLTLVVWLTILGVGAAIGLPAANRLLSNIVSPSRLGLAFGIKQSAPPTSAMIAGLSLPLIVVALGWRAAYFVAAGLALIVVFTAGRQPARPPRDRAAVDGPIEHRSIIRLLAVAFGMAAAATQAVTTFYVDAAVMAGSTQQFAGIVLALGSITAIVVRVVTGVVSDRRAQGHLELCVVLILVGSVGFVLLAVGSPALMALGALVAMGGVWGFAGVFWYAIVRAYPRTPGKVSGAVFPGGLLGGTLGPTAFGVIAEQVGYPTAWVTGGVIALVAAATMLYGAKQLGHAQASAA